MKQLNGFFIMALVLLPTGSWARPMIFSDVEMTRRATAIAQVQISTGAFPGVSAVVIKNVKGALPHEISVSERNPMECGRTVAPGEYVIFVMKTKGGYETANCGRAWLPIKDGKVSWFRDLSTGKDGRTISLREVFKEIKALGNK